MPARGYKKCSDRYFSIVKLGWAAMSFRAAQRAVSRSPFIADQGARYSIEMMMPAGAAMTLRTERLWP